MAGFDDFKKDRARAGLLDMQSQMGQLSLDRAKRDAANEQGLQGLMPQFFTPAVPGSMGDANLPPELRTGAVAAPGQPAKFDVPGYTTAARNKGYMSPLQALQMQAAAAKDDAPIKLGAGDTLLDRKTLQPVFTAPDKKSLPAAIQEYEYAKAQGYSGSFDQWDQARKKAGATNVQLAVNTEKSLLNDLAGGLGKSMVDARSGAQSALGTIGTVNRLMDALDTNKVMAGPGTTFRQYGLQVGNLLGVSGKDANEKMLNTRQAIQSLAQLELDAAQQMKGQGQITEAERSIIRRAASGDIDGMTTGELRLLGGVLDRTARSKIQGYNSQVKPLMSNPNAAPIAPFLNVEEPPARPAAGGIRRFNPATGKIE
jgi:hypothetical protein